MAAVRRLIAGNWKMNLLRAEAAALARNLRDLLREGDSLGASVAVCPPFTTLDAVGKELRGSPIAWGGQDCHAEKAGAFTGSVSAEMLRDLGCAYVIVGHSERRHGLGETNEAVARKAQAGWRAGLTPILCVGETLAERDKGKTLEVVARQLIDSLVLREANAPLVVAYEPVWAIGTGKVPTERDIATVHNNVRMVLRNLTDPPVDHRAIPILYGGSAKPDNAKAILGVDDVGGLLVGGASLDAKGFAAMVQAAG
jgi:triosephosphate isomerase (TIM)